MKWFVTDAQWQNMRETRYAEGWAKGHTVGKDRILDLEAQYEARSERELPITWYGGIGFTPLGMGRL